MYEISQGVVFVKGALNGALYDFNTNKVYSINESACTIMEKLINKKQDLSIEEKSYISQLEENKLYHHNYTVKKYVPKSEIDNIYLSMTWLEITQGCNLRCLHCYQGEEYIVGSNIQTIEKWKEVIDELHKLSVSRVVVIGGEPCSYKNIKELLIYLSQYDIDSTLFTNGTLLDEELINIVTEKNIKVKVSLYGHIAEVHDRITKIKGSFEKLIKNIKHLKRNGVTVDIAVVVMKENQEYLDEIRSFIQSLDVPYHGYDVIRNVYGGSQSEHTPDKAEVIAMAKFTKPAFATSKEHFDSNFSKNSCWYGKLALTENGDVIPCVYERSITYGNVNKNSLTEILKSQQLKDNWFRSFGEIETCKDCEYRYACKDCRPLGISVCGNINGKNPRCLYDPYNGEWQKNN